MADMAFPHAVSDPAFTAFTTFCSNDTPEAPHYNRNRFFTYLSATFEAPRSRSIINAGINKLNSGKVLSS